MSAIEWRDVPGYEGLYQVSDTGLVLSLPREGSDGRILRPDITRDGYAQVRLCKNGLKHRWLVHRLVALAFLPNPALKAEVNHIDGDKLNNALSNLEWSTRSENQQHAYDNGLTHANKVRRANARAVRRSDGVVFESLSKAARALGSPWAVSTISECCNGKRRTCCGYTWQYEEA